MTNVPGDWAHQDLSSRLRIVRKRQKIGQTPGALSALNTHLQMEYLKLSSMLILEVVIYSKKAWDTRRLTVGRSRQTDHSRIREAGDAHARNSPSLRHLRQIHFKCRKQMMIFNLSVSTGLLLSDFHRLGAILVGCEQFSRECYLCHLFRFDTSR